MTAEAWLTNYCLDHDIDWTKLSKAELFQLSMIVPCTIRCFRIGGSVEVSLGEKCPECGKVHNPPPRVTKYDVIKAAAF